jgi:hypothetical protein
MNRIQRYVLDSLPCSPWLGVRHTIIPGWLEDQVMPIGRRGSRTWHR